MEENTDTALFGDDNYNVDGYVDCYMSPTGGAKADVSKNGIGAISVGSLNVVTVELKKSLNSGDTDGRDINWAANETHTMIIIWDSNGRGSSGGTASHAGGTLGTGTVRTILVNPNEKAGSAADGGTAFPSSTYIVALVAVAAVAILVLAVIFRRRK
jgi:hypothetical protein